MAAGRSFKSLVGRRRRAWEEGEEEDGSVAVEDSQSEGSVLSDMDDDVDANSVGAPSAAEAGAVDGAAGSTGISMGRPKDRKRHEKNDQAASSGFKSLPDTEAMMNGLNIDERPEQETEDFNSVGRSENGVGDAAPLDLPASNDKDRSKRDAGPASIPNRGNFFMHDTRTNNTNSNQPIRGAWNSRGRGRGIATVGGPFSPASQMSQQERVAELPWKHDLHDTINEEPAAVKPTNSVQEKDESARLFPKGGLGHQNTHGIPHTKLSFSSTTHIGKVQIRVFLPGMPAPITFPDVPWKRYTRLPDHRPPLRRDKPVRISLPTHMQRYVFPSPQRSFIFIPRQMRPNQQNHGSRYQRSVGGYGYSSRRTSMYGGSIYAASVAASRRSSFASVNREHAFSPVGAYGGMPPSRPIVRLPHGSQSQFSAVSTPMDPLSGVQTPTGYQMHTYPLPAQPQFQGTPTTTMHQPKPQKAISVTGIESPAVLQQAAPTHESQPFANQLPAAMNEQPAFQLSQAYFSPRASFSYYPQPETGTPLSGIPEQAMHAQPYQPPMMPYSQGQYYPPYNQQQGFYYAPGSGGFGSMQMYVPPPPPHQTYMVSPPGQAIPPPQATPQQRSQQADENEQLLQPQSGMVAHESNGMVFYMPASEAQNQTQGETYQPAESFVPSYAMPGLPPPTPAPEAAYYYPQQLPAPNYYPAQSQQ